MLETMVPMVFDLEGAIKRSILGNWRTRTYLQMLESTSHKITYIN